MNTAVITFTRDGAGHALYTETIDLAEIGSLAIQRATTIEFDNLTQCWLVRDPAGVPLYANPSRLQCLAWERQYLETKEDQKHELQHCSGAVAAGPGIDRAQDHDTGGHLPDLQ